MPLETDSNVPDDVPEQQESHIDLINETARMKTSLKIFEPNQDRQIIDKMMKHLTVEEIK